MTSKIEVHFEDKGERGRIAHLAIANPARLNVLDAALMDEIQAALGELFGDETLRCLVVRGAGERAFVGGADIAEMAALDGTSARAFIERLHRTCNAFRTLPVPVIARIQGYALGAGLELAASCDVRIASEDAAFGMPEVKVGIPSVIEAALLPRLVGWGRTRELLFTGRTIGAKEALRIGLIEAVVPAAELDRAVAERADAIVAAGPRAIRLQKALINRWQELSLSEAIEAGIESFANAYESDEPRRAMAAFLERRRERQAGDR